LIRVKEDDYQVDLIGRQLEDLSDPVGWDSSIDIDAAIGAGFGVGIAPRFDLASLSAEDISNLTVDQLLELQ
jgi:hypothetical protein